MTWLDQNMLPCFYKKFLGVECPGCGMQRSIVSLLKGDFNESFAFYPPLLLVLSLITLLAIHLIFDLKNGAFMLKWTFIINVLAIIANFIFKMSVL